MTDQDKKPKKDKTLDTVAKSLLVIWICIGIAFGISIGIAFGIKIAAITLMAFIVLGLVCMAVNRI